MPAFLNQNLIHKSTVQPSNVWLNLHINNTYFYCHRNLRGEIEKQNLAVNREFFEALRTMKNQVDSLCGDINVMSDCCEQMISQLNSTKEKTHGECIFMDSWDPVCPKPS